MVVHLAGRSAEKLVCASPWEGEVCPECGAVCT
jgi:hypothetical protein